MYYSKKTLQSDWHKNREAEPKDHDITVHQDEARRLHKSTYTHFGTHLDADWKTTTQMAQSEKKQEVNDPAKSMVQADNFHSLVFDRDKETSVTAGKSILSYSDPPCCSENKLITTYALDYVPSRITIKQEMQAKELVDRKLDFKKRQSQFTDVADHRRCGRNTWQDFNDAQAVVRGVAKSLYRQINLPCP